MAGLREALAAVLAVGLGLLLIAAPEALVRVHTAGRLPNDRGGSWGEDKPLPALWRRAIQGLGVLCVGAGLYFGWLVVG